MKYFAFIIFFFLLQNLQGQSPVDSLVRKDTLPATDTLATPDSLNYVSAAVSDSLMALAGADSIKLQLQFPFNSDSFRYRQRMFFKFTSTIRYSITEKSWQGKEVIFYCVISLLLFFALIKNNFRRYLADLFSTYFRTTLRQRQMKEQLMQNPLPSLLYNLFFVVSTSIFLALIFEFYQWAHQYPFWQKAIYAAMGLTVIYTGKYLALKFFGWVFKMSDTTEAYIFIIFSTNKVLGVIILPFIILLAFTYGNIHHTTVTLSLILVGCLFLYRYFLSFISVNHKLKINFFHFIVYLAAFEVIPLLLINKLLFTILREIS